MRKMQRSRAEKRITFVIYLLLLTNMLILALLNLDLFTRYQEFTKQNIKHYTEKIQTEVESYLESAIISDRLIINLWDTQRDFYEEALRHEEAIKKVILSFNQINAIYYGDEHGNFVFYLKIDPDTVNTKIITHGKSGAVTTFREFKADRLQLVRHEQGTDFDPRVRPWYKKDLTEGLSIVDPYTFYTTQAEGITLSRQIIENNALWGNYGIDIELADIRSFLIQEKAGRDFSSRLETANGILVAESIDEQSLSSYERIEALNLDENGEVVALEEGIYGVKKKILVGLNNPLNLVIVANFRHYLRSVRLNQLVVIVTIIILMVLFFNSIAMNWYYNRSRKNLIEIATKDELTGLSNRHVFKPIFEEKKVLAQLENEPFSILLCDIDHFKAVNDEFGHNNGDLVLQEIAALLKRIARSTDEVFRWGGEEFLVFLSNTTRESAQKTAERVRVEIENTRVTIGRLTIQCTMSVGVCEYEKGMDDKEIVKLADDQLYQAKRTGRNKVCVHKGAEQGES